MTRASPAPLNEHDLILCDFDGTISVIDTGLLVAHTFGLEPFDAIEQRWRRGEISSRECLRDQWALVDTAREDFWQLIANLEVDPAFPGLVTLARERRARLAILSDGLDLYLQQTLDRLGLGEVEFHANHAALRDGHVVMEFPHSVAHCPDCGNCKTRWLFDLRPGAARTIYVGDGYSDLCAARYADLVFAKDDLARIYQERRLPFIPFTCLAEVVARLRDGTPTGGGD